MKTRKNKFTNRMLSLFLCLVFAVACMPLTAFAEENTTITGEGTLEEPKVTVTTSTTQDESTGNTTTTVTTTTESSGTNEAGASVSTTETEQETIVTDSEDKLVDNFGYEEGSETTKSEKTNDVQDTTVIFDDMTSGQTKTETSGTSSTETTGDVKENEDDTEYDYTTTTETPREAEVTLKDVEVTAGNVGDVKVELETVKPAKTGKEENIITYDPDTLRYGAKTDEEIAARPDGYDFFFSYYGWDSDYDVKETDSAGNTNTESIVYLGMTNAISKEDFSAYCVDYNTSAVYGDWYRIENLEEADYYTDKDAKHIRAIVMNGYWGTASGTGSLSQMIQTLKAAIDKDPNALGGLTKDDIENLTDGEAQAATQMAIWTFANRLTEDVTMEAHYDTSSELSEERAAALNRINKVVEYLITLTQDKTTTTEVLTSDKFVDLVGLTIGNKVADHVNNQDNDKTNDAYNASLVFALEVQITEKDDLIVKVVDPNGNVLRTVRLAGDDSETNYGPILLPDENGNYTISNLVLVEGDVILDLVLEGAQYLEEGVYIYSSYGGYDVSQTAVSIAEGYHAVNLAMNIKLNFNVEEGTIETHREWRSEWDSFIDDKHNEGNNDDDTTVTVVKTSSSKTVDTGDNSASTVQFFTILLTLSGAAILTMILVMKRRRS